MRKKLVLMLLLICAAGAGYFVWNGHFSPKARAIQLVKDSLNDPDSAIFEQVRHVPRTGATCGGINAKNRMGGYVGMTTFIVGKDGSVTFGPTGNTDSGSTESRIQALQEQIDFLEKMEVCDTEASEA